MDTENICLTHLELLELEFQQMFLKSSSDFYEYFSEFEIFFINLSKGLWVRS